MTSPTTAVSASATPARATPRPGSLVQPLPQELAGSGQGWFTRYRRWPVFSPAWVRCRLLTVALPMIAVFVLFIGLSAPPDPAERPYGAIATLTFHLAMPLLAGPWLASRVRLREWPVERETRALWAVMALVIAAQFAAHLWVAEPVKQAIAEATGQVDATGRRKPVALIIGVTVGRPDGSSLAAGRDAESRPDPLARALNFAGAGLITFLLAGGAGLGALRRERAGLGALAQERALAQAEVQRREAELRLSVLAAQVEPHFLFNTLAGVRSAIATDPARASEMVDALVAYLRAAIPRLRSDGRADTTLAAQIEIVRAYLALMAARLPRLKFEIDLRPELAGLPFPPLMLISLAENAVKHGVEPKIGPARITLRAGRDASGRLAVTVADDGVGFGGSTAGTGLGLTNLRERLRHLYHGRAELMLKARPEGGVAATIAVPIDPDAA